jgi:hypothetical protein
MPASGNCQVNTLKVIKINYIPDKLFGGFFVGKCENILPKTDSYPSRNSRPCKLTSPAGSSGNGKPRNNMAGTSEILGQAAGIKC